MDNFDKKQQPTPRDPADWVESIGPEDKDTEDVAENIEEYGWEQMDEGNFVSDPVMPANMPDWGAPKDNNNEHTAQDGSINQELLGEDPLEQADPDAEEPAEANKS